MLSKCQHWFKFEFIFSHDLYIITSQWQISSQYYGFSEFYYKSKHKEMFHSQIRNNTGLYFKILNPVTHKSRDV